MYGLVGASGHGKTTLMKILAGDIRGEGVSLHYQAFEDQKTLYLHWDLRSLEDSLQKNKLHKNYDDYQHQINQINQEAYLFSASLRFNITLGQHEDTFSEFWEQIEQEMFYLKEMKWSGETMLTPECLSLGQIQLVMGLRACFHKRPFILLDEIASSLDSLLEESLQKILRRLQQESTIVVVAHRLETLKKADRIFLLHHGSLSMEGTHEELCKNSLLYKTFLESLRSSADSHLVVP
jgi:ATP-binding cassette subfamily B protein